MEQRVEGHDSEYTPQPRLQRVITLKHVTVMASLSETKMNAHGFSDFEG